MDVVTTIQTFTLTVLHSCVLTQEDLVSRQQCKLSAEQVVSCWEERQPQRGAPVLRPGTTLSLGTC